MTHSSLRLVRICNYSGWEQAQKTGAYLKKYISEKIENPLIHVYTSPFLRVMQTASAIRKELGEVTGGTIFVSDAICEHLSTEYYK